MQKFFSFAWCKPLLSQQCHFKTLTNERTINRIVDQTFEEIDSFSKIVLKSLNNKNKASHVKFDFLNFLKALWKKGHFENMRKGLLYFDVTVLRKQRQILWIWYVIILGGNFVGCICSTLWVHIQCTLFRLQFEKLAGVYIRICLSQRGTHYELSAIIGILMVQAVI
mgnify:CR=1 FL=1